MPSEVGKDELLRELTMLFRMEKDPKLKSEIAMKLADLKQLKKEEIKQDQQVKYYISLPESEFLDYIKSKFQSNEVFRSEIKKICKI